MPRTRRIALGAALVAVLALPTAVGAQDVGGDDSLERLLEKLGEPARPSEGTDTDAEPAPGEVSEEDRSLDSLLEKLGGTLNEPSPDGQPPRPGPGPADQPPPDEAGPSRPQEPKEEGLTGDEKSLDEHLEEILGRKKKDQQDQDGDPTGPLAEAIKKMEEVRKRLADTDTGEDTRQKQGEVITELDKILEQLRRAQGQSSGQSQQRLSRRTQQAGNQPGQQGNQPGQQGNTGEGVGPQMPQRPTDEPSLANRKDIWGDLPPQLREAMDNVLNEQMLESKRELITRYFDSVAQKGQSEDR